MDGFYRDGIRWINQLSSFQHFQFVTKFSCVRHFDNLSYAQMDTLAKAPNLQLRDYKTSLEHGLLMLVELSVRSNLVQMAKSKNHTNHNQSKCISLRHAI